MAPHYVIYPLSGLIFRRYAGNLHPTFGGVETMVSVHCGEVETMGCMHVWRYSYQYAIQGVLDIAYMFLIQVLLLKMTNKLCYFISCNTWKNGAIKKKNNKST